MSQPFFKLAAIDLCQDGQHFLMGPGSTMTWFKQQIQQLADDCRGSVFVEYLLLVTIVGIGVIAGLATVRGSLLNELLELAEAITNLTP